MDFSTKNGDLAACGLENPDTPDSQNSDEPNPEPENNLNMVQINQIRDFVNDTIDSVRLLRSKLINDKELYHLVDKISHQSRLILKILDGTSQEVQASVKNEYYDPDSEEGLEKISRLMRGKYSKRTKLLEFGRCSFPPTNLNTAEAAYDRFKTFYTILKHFRDYERDKFIKNGYPGGNPRTSYSVHGFHTLLSPRVDFNLRAYCKSRAKHKCPVVLILEYEWSTQIYKLLKTGIHNHALEAHRKSKWDEILETDAANIQVLGSKIRKSMVEIPTEEENEDDRVFVKEEPMCF